MRKKRIFIGSSSEELKLANSAKVILERDFEVTIWNDSVWDSSIFKINNNFLNDLLKASLQFDFGILLGTTDDKVEYRESIVMQPRDNVLFELGLFIGRLGLSKCAFVVDKELKVLSDISGISLARFEKGEVSSFTTAISQVGEMFKNQIDSDINFFPSSTLASVYFENLISPTCKFIIENGGFEEDRKKYPECKIQIIIPKRLNSDVNLQFEQLKRGFKTKSVSFNYAGRPRFINLETEIKDGKLIFIDFPTVLSGINYAISNLLPQDFNQMSADYDQIINRELERFIYSIKQLALRSGFDDFLEIKREEIK
ncbi:CBASS system CD-NTase-associated NAD(+) hydrolase Cap12 [Marivirga harenae]|uniref:CBASS system CD-NTase-associated NAD(+) hydrolase Cap12 n=1 Tax=Marivirga harenae TaxID=2010992 RepID=UPI0026DF858E|nr:STING domain-containing protein [Marivirga harenae]WKV11258.1 nucleotide-binding protein [Marivirga harenae]